MLTNQIIALYSANCTLATGLLNAAVAYYFTRRRP
ncbi:hypothetical protein QFZ63_001507 [Streptomyces sp. B3I7]|nr:hypothetical protein [Streptomyces sp. B3I7]